MSQTKRPPSSTENDRLIEESAATRAIGIGTCSCSTKHIIGVVLIVVVASIWTIASFVVQIVQVDYGFEKPVFITYVSNGLFSVLLAAELARARLGASSDTFKFLRHPGDASWRREMLGAARLALIWFTAQGSYNWGLAGTTVSVSTILSATSCVFTLILSITILREQLTLLILLGVLLNVSGAALAAVMSQDQTQGTNTAWGVGLSLGSAALYGVYSVMIRNMTPAEGDPDEGTFNMRVLFGFVGLFNLILLLPVVIILHVTGIESLDSLTWPIFGLVLLKGFIDNVLGDILWAFAIVLTSPTAATVGLTLTVPMAIISDWIIHHIVPSGLMLLGAGLVVSGFIAASVVDTKKRPLEEASDGSEEELEQLVDDAEAAAASATAALQELGTPEAVAKREAVPAPSPLSDAEDSSS